MARPLPISALIDDQLAYLDEQSRSIVEVESAIRKMIVLVDGVLAQARKDFGALAYPVEEQCERQRARIYSLRVEYGVDPSSLSVFVVPVAMSVWQVARAVYGNALRTDKIYSANTIVNPLRIPMGTRIRVINNAT